MKPEDYGYVVKNNLCLFQKGPLSNWWGGFKGQNGGFGIPWYMMVETPKIINWLRSNGYDIALDHQWNCVEQYMMAAKAAMFDDIKTFQKILNTTHPEEQKKLGRGVNGFQPEVWNNRKFWIVGDAITAKFDQNYELQVFLEQFHPQTIFAEAAPWDKIWGIGLGPNDSKALDINTWEGENFLGKIISRVRMDMDIERKIKDE